MPAQIMWDRGWALRAARHLYQPGELVRATNVLNDELGALSTRPGMSAIGNVSSSASTPNLHSIYTMYRADAAIIRYQAFTESTMSLMRDFTMVLASGLSHHFVDFTDMKGYNEDTVWTFFAGELDALRRKDDGTNFRKWGIDAPANAPTLAQVVGGGSLSTGTYKVVYTFVREVAGVKVHEGNSSAESAGQAVNANDRITVTNIRNPADPADVDYDPQITHVYLYRTVANGDVFLFDTRISATGTGTLTSTLSKIDSALAELVELDNQRPPALSSVTRHKEHLVGVTGTDHKLRFSKRFRPESWPSNNYLEIGSPSDPILMVRSFLDRLLVWTRTHLWEIVGGPDETQWLPVDTGTSTGLEDRFSMALGLQGVYWRGHDGIYRWNGAQGLNITDDRLFPLFHGRMVEGFAPAVSTSATVCGAGGWYQGKYYYSYTTDHLSPSRTLVYDEATNMFFDDSRAFQRFAYESRDRRLTTCQKGNWAVLDLVDRATGSDVSLEITADIQTRDEDEQQPLRDKDLIEVGVDLMGMGSSMTLTAIRQYGALSPIAFSGSLQTNGRATVLVRPSTSVISQAIGYRLTWTGACTLYRLIPTANTWPQTRTTYRLPGMDLGNPDLKAASWIDLDLDALDTGQVDIIVRLDGTQVVRIPILLTAGQRRRTGRLRLPPHPRGRLVELELANVGGARWRWWGGELCYQAFGQHPGVQRVSLAQVGAS